jgi:glycosyltransferase involved in cell wall biosynthesis
VPRRVTIVTAGHLSTCPRMLKAADALHDAGYRVRVVSVNQTPWAARSDARLRPMRPWRWDVVDASRASASARWLLNGARFRVAQAVAAKLGKRRPYALTIRAFSRVHDALTAEVLREPADLIYGGTTGALAAIATAGRRSGTPFAVDFEDFHCGEHAESAEGRLANELAGSVMADVVRDAVFVTAGSAAIADACRGRFGIAPVTIDNVFPLPTQPPAAGDDDRVPRFYWFSQTIGAGRGLDHLVRAAGRLGRPCEVHLRGVSRNGALQSLRALAADVAPQVSIHVHAPADPWSMVSTCRPFTIGVAVEPGSSVNNALILSNKVLTYPLAGLPVMLTDTAGHRPLAADLADGALACAPGDIDAMADGAARWLDHAPALRRAREASWHAARTRWHWEHEEERGAFLGCVARAVA